jgi:hypothetical protein
MTTIERLALKACGPQAARYAARAGGRAPSPMRHRPSRHSTWPIASAAFSDRRGRQRMRNGWRFPAVAATASARMGDVIANGSWHVVAAAECDVSSAIP